MQSKKPSREELSQMRQDMQLIRGRLKIAQRTHLISALTQAAYIVGSGCMLFPPLHPLAAVLFVASAVVSLANKIFVQIKQYQFEDHFKMIARPEGTSGEIKGAKRVLDFVKWQVGWYQETSLLKQLIKVGSHSWKNCIDLGQCVAVLSKAISASRAVFGLIGKI